MKLALLIFSMALMPLSSGLQFSALMQSGSLNEQEIERNLGGKGEGKGKVSGVNVKVYMSYIMNSLRV